MPGSGLREDEPELAVLKILDGAAHAFVERGGARGGTGEISRHAGCSRGALSRSFKNRHELYLAFVKGRALRGVGYGPQFARHLPATGQNVSYRR